MNVALLQLDIQWGQPMENIQRAKRLMDTSGDAQLYVLPEMWATGFVTEPSGMAEDERASVSLEWMRTVSKERNCAICGSLAIQTEDGSYRNRQYFVTPQRVDYYDKHHLFTHGGEHRHYTAGSQHKIVEWMGVRFLLLTCYDLRFPVWARYGLAGEYDAIIYVANWPQSRQEAWRVLTQARAIENQCYVVAVNRVGSDPVTSYAGGSSLIDPVGRMIVESKENAKQALVAPLSIDVLQKARSRFRVLADRDAGILFSA